MKDLSCRSQKTEVKESPIHGKGLFAKEAIAAGEIVAVKGGHILRDRDRKGLDEERTAGKIPGLVLLVSSEKD